MEKKIKSRYDGFIFFKKDLLMLTLIFILFSFGRFLDYDSIFDSSVFWRDYVIGEISIKYLLSDLLFIFVLIIGIIFYYLSNKYSFYKGISVTLIFAILITFLLGHVSISDAVIFNISYIILLFLLVTSINDHNDNIKKYIIFYFSIVCILYMILLIYFFLTENYIKDRVTSLLSSSKPVTAIDYLLIEIRSNFSNAKVLGEGEWYYEIELDLSQYLKPFELNPYFMLTYVLFKYGIISFIMTIIIYVFLCKRMWSFTARQKNNILCFILSSSITITLSIKLVFYTLSNVGLSCFRTSLVFFSGSLSSLLINFSFYILFLCVFHKLNVSVKSKSE